VAAQLRLLAQSRAVRLRMLVMLFIRTPGFQ
jgi:hypothetical protein